MDRSAKGSWASKPIPDCGGDRPQAVLDVLGKVGKHNHRPLQSLGGMMRHHLDRVDGRIGQYVLSCWAISLSQRMRPEIEAACCPLQAGGSSYCSASSHQGFQVGQAHTDTIQIRRPARHFFREGAGGDHCRKCSRRLAPARYPAGQPMISAIGAAARPSMASSSHRSAFPAFAKYFRRSATHTSGSRPSNSATHNLGSSHRIAWVKRGGANRQVLA